MRRAPNHWAYLLEALSWAIHQWSKEKPAAPVVFMKARSLSSHQSWKERRPVSAPAFAAFGPAHAVQSGFWRKGSEG